MTSTQLNSPTIKQVHFGSVVIIPELDETTITEININDLPIKTPIKVYPNKIVRAHRIVPILEGEPFNPNLAVEGQLTDKIVVNCMCIIC